MPLRCNMLPLLLRCADAAATPRLHVRGAALRSAAAAVCQALGDPKEAARKKAEASRAAAAAARLAKDAAGSKKISSFFTAKAKKG